MEIGDGTPWGNELVAGGPQRIIEGVQWWRDHNGDGGNLNDVSPSPVIVEHTDAAWDRLQGHMTDIRRRNKHEAGPRKAIWARVGEKSCRLALAFACSRITGRDVIVISAQDADRGIALANWSARHMIGRACEFVTESLHDEKVRSVIAKMAPAEWIGQRDLNRKLRFLPKRERMDIVQDLIDMEVVSTGGRPAVMYRRKGCETCQISAPKEV